jgi:hypothetical protein
MPPYLGLSDRPAPGPFPQLPPTLRTTSSPSRTENGIGTHVGSTTRPPRAPPLRFRGIAIERNFVGIAELGHVVTRSGRYAPLAPGLGVGDARQPAPRAFDEGIPASGRQVTHHGQRKTTDPPRATTVFDLATLFQIDTLVVAEHRDPPRLTLFVIQLHIDGRGKPRGYFDGEPHRTSLGRIGGQSLRARAGQRQCQP